MKAREHDRQEQGDRVSSDPVISHPYLVGLVVITGILMHPSGVAVAIIGFACAVVIAEIIDHKLIKRL